MIAARRALCQAATGPRPLPIKRAANEQAADGQTSIFKRIACSSSIAAGIGGTQWRPRGLFRDMAMPARPGTALAFVRGVLGELVV